MLILARRPGERVVIGDEILVTVMEVSASTVRLGIEAPRGVSIFREEIWLAVKEENRAAAAADVDALPSQAGTVPSQGNVLPSQAGTVPSQGNVLPSQAGTVPSQAGTSQADVLPSELVREPPAEPVDEPPSEPVDEVPPSH